MNFILNAYTMVYMVYLYNNDLSVLNKKKLKLINRNITKRKKFGSLKVKVQMHVTQYRKLLKPICRSTHSCKPYGNTFILPHEFINELLIFKTTPFS